MTIVSKFHTLYLIRKAIGPTLFAFLSLLFLYQGFSLNNFFQIKISIFLFLVCISFSIINLKSIYKLVIEESSIVKISIFYGVKKYIALSSIKASHLDYIQGVATEAGQINPGYYECVLILENDKKLIISPEKFKNYSEIIKAISHNRTKLNNLQGSS